jgi:hypothetical protein
VYGAGYRNENDTVEKVYKHSLVLVPNFSCQLSCALPLFGFIRLSGRTNTNCSTHHNISSVQLYTYQISP